MAFQLYEILANPVVLYPMYDYADDAAKVEDRIRTRDGTPYFYKWSEYIEITFSVEFVPTVDRDIINGWWSANTPLFFTEIGNPTIHEVCLFNDNRPLSELNKPYRDQWRGILELEGR